MAFNSVRHKPSIYVGNVGIHLRTPRFTVGDYYVTLLEFCGILCEGCKEEAKQAYTIEDFSGYYCEHCYDELQCEMMLEAEVQQGD